MSVRYDFSDAEVINSLPIRHEPHWHILQFCRHLGVIRRGSCGLGWVARFRTKAGGYRQTYLGPLDLNGEVGLSHADALQAAEHWFSEPANTCVSSDPYPSGSKAGLDYCPWGTVFTVGHAMRDYIEWKRIAATQATFDALVSLINHHILPRLGTLPLADFNGIRMKDFVLEVLETPPKRGKRATGPRRKLSDLNEEDLRTRKATVNTLVGIMRLALKLAWENGETDNERAWRCIRRLPNRARPRTLFLDRQECSALLDRCRPDLRELVLGALYTGCRVTELERLRVRDVAQNVFGLYVQASKSGSARFVFLPDEGLAFFLAMIEGRGQDEPVFLHKDGRSWRGRHKHLFRQAVAEAQLPAGFVFHGLRHTYASQLVQAATPLLVVSQQLGHATTDTVARTYGHLAPQIRAAQIRRNFAPLMPDQAQQDAGIRIKVTELAMHLENSDWRSYAPLEPEGSWPKANYGTCGAWPRSALTRHR